MEPTQRIFYPYGPKWLLYQFAVIFGGGLYLAGVIYFSAHWAFFDPMFWLTCVIWPILAVKLAFSRTRIVLDSLSREVNIQKSFFLFRWKSIRLKFEQIDAVRWLQPDKHSKFDLTLFARGQRYVLAQASKPDDNLLAELQTRLDLAGPTTERAETLCSQPVHSVTP